MRQRSFSRLCFAGILLLALPGSMWTALEMYGLTLRGPQMLFYSIIHAMPPLVLLVALSLPLGAILLLLSSIALYSSRYRAKLAISRQALGIFIAEFLLRLALFSSYRNCARIPSLRILVCLVGLSMIALVIIMAWTWINLKEPIAETEATV